MGYRRLFIMRKDLNMLPGKLATQVGHCAEAFWAHLLRVNAELITGDEYEIKGLRLSAKILR